MTERNIVVLAGGLSSEKEVSIHSGMAVHKALHEIGYKAALEVLSSREIPASLNPERDVLFLTTHGTFGEDGQLQRLLERQGFSYTGSEASSSALCFDKRATKHLAESLGLKVAKHVFFSSPPSAHALWSQLGKMVLKPNADGSSVGLHIIESEEQLAKVLPTLEPQKAYLAEQFIEGRELTVGVLQGDIEQWEQKPQPISSVLGKISTVPLSAVEIFADGGIYDYDHKYNTREPKSAIKTQYRFPAVLNVEKSEELREAAEKIFNAAGCRDFARVDFRLTSDGNPYSKEGELYMLEVNTLPGMTATSLLPKSAQGYSSSLTFHKLVNTMISGALSRHAKKHETALA